MFANPVFRVLTATWDQPGNKEMLVKRDLLARKVKKVLLEGKALRYVKIIAKKLSACF